MFKKIDGIENDFIIHFTYIIYILESYRFLLLFFNCMLTFGSYFCFDMPSVLQAQFTGVSKLLFFFIWKIGKNLIWFISLWNFFNQFIVSFLSVTALSDGDKLLIISHNVHSCNKDEEVYQTHNWLRRKIWFNPPFL